MTKEDILYLSDLNLAEYIRETARWNAASEIFEHEDLLLTQGPHRFPPTSLAMNLSPVRDDSGLAVFDRIRSFYRDRKSGFGIHIRSHLDPGLDAVCKKEEMIRIFDAPGMIVDRPFDGNDAAEGIEIRPVTDPAGVADFATVCMDSFQSLDMPVFVSRAIFAFPERFLKPNTFMVVAYNLGKPASAAMAIFSHGIAGLYWVGTVTSARGKGLAEACVRTVANEAFRRGAHIVVLQASKFGEPLYRRMGFTEITRYPCYMKFV